jgi:hypothetical protein
MQRKDGVSGGKTISVNDKHKTYVSTYESTSIS